MFLYSIYYNVAPIEEKWHNNGFQVILNIYRIAWMPNAVFFWSTFEKKVIISLLQPLWLQRNTGHEFDIELSYTSSHNK